MCAKIPSDGNAFLTELLWCETRRLKLRKSKPNGPAKNRAGTPKRSRHQQMLKFDLRRFVEITFRIIKKKPPNSSPPHAELLDVLHAARLDVPHAAGLDVPHAAALDVACGTSPRPTFDEIGRREDLLHEDL